MAMTHAATRRANAEPVTALDSLALIARNVHHLRMARKLTQTELGHLLAWPVARVGLVESAGDAGLTLDDLDALSAALGVQPYALFAV
jgi:transcriptional regulator with XRE-family HTH domain